MDQATVDSMGEWYHRIDFGNGVVSKAKQDQSIAYDIISPGFMEPLEGKRVLEIASNAGGLSLHLVRAGAKVTAVEPVRIFRKQAKLVREHFRLRNLKLLNDTIYNCYKWGTFDIVIFHGLIYHLRHPQLVLDMLAHITKEQIFVSSQITRGDDPILSNRRANSKFKRLGKSDKKLLGWEPTLSALQRMIELAGFRDVKLLSKRPHAAEGAGLFASNDVYICASASKSRPPIPGVYEDKIRDLL
ncbi:MAG: methyltransferase domain-containing protein [Pseudomonadota bacterium]